MCIRDRDCPVEAFLGGDVSHSVEGELVALELLVCDTAPVSYTHLAGLATPAVLHGQQPVGDAPTVAAHMPCARVLHPDGAARQGGIPRRQGAVEKERPGGEDVYKRQI